MKKIFTLFVAMIIAIPMFFLVGCTGGDHTHNFAATWSYDATHHWYACKGEDCEETKDKAEHTMVENTCSVCGYSVTAPVVTTKYNYVAAKTDSLSGSSAIVHEFSQTELTLDEKMSIEVSSNNTFKLTLENTSDYEYNKRVATGTFNNDGTFEIKNATYTQTVFGVEVFTQPLTEIEIEDVTSLLRFDFVGDNYFVLQNMGFNFVFVKENYTPVVGETIVANLPFRVATLLMSNFAGECGGFATDITLPDLTTYIPQIASYVTVDTDGKLTYKPITVEEFVAFDNLSFVEDNTPSNDDNKLVVGEFGDVNLCLDLNEEKTSTTDDDTVLPLVSFKVVGATVDISLVIDGDPYFPAFVDKEDTIETYLEREGFSYSYRGETPVLVTEEMVTTFDLNYDGGKNAKVVLTLPSTEYPGNVGVCEFILPICDLSDSTITHFYPVNKILNGPMVTVEKNGDLTAALKEQCALGYKTRFEQVFESDISDLVDAGDLTISAVDTTTPGYKIATLTFAYDTDKTYTQDVLVIVADPENPVVCEYGSIFIEVDDSVTDSELAETLNNLQVAVPALTFNGDYVDEYTTVDFNDLMGIEEFETDTVRDIYDEFVATYEYAAQLEFNLTSTVYGNYTYTQTVYVLFF